MNSKYRLLTLMLRRLTLLLSLLLYTASGGTFAQSQNNESEEGEAQTEQQETPPHWIDNFKGGVENTVDNTARWFDRFFGNSRRFEDSYNSQGRLTIEPQWSQYDGWEVKSSFRAEFKLPQAEERFSAIVGRGNFDDVVTDEPDQFRNSVIDSGEDEEWILGLGFNPNQGETNRFYFSAGIRGGLDLDPYAQVRYLWQRRMTDFSQLRLRSTLFWRDSDGFGVNQRLDWEASMREAWLARITLDGTHAERTQGVRWATIAALYHLYSEEKAIAAELFTRGQSSQQIPLRDAGFRFIHRQEFFRDWLYLEFWGGMHWPRELPEERRQQQWMFGIEIAMWYGAQ
ncbi:hypothetical protein [Aliidiomarina sp. B3213]|nr:hypothetical protein [Aliidiomarina sp. B3213]RTE85740.1 hypothetical protein DQX04_09825 [Aliidiomarina sp. B3213]